MIKWIFTGIFRWVLFEVSKSEILNGSINLMSSGSSEVFKDGEFDGLLFGVSLVL